MTTATVNIAPTIMPGVHRPAHLPAYTRTGCLHSGLQPFEAQMTCVNFIEVLETRDQAQADQLEELLLLQGDPQQNGSLTGDQARLVAKMARRFDREGDTFARDSAELALNGSELMLDEVRPQTLAESMQVDREGRRARELRDLLLSVASHPGYHLN